MATPRSNKPSIFYTRVLDHSLGVMVAQNNEDGKEVALYNLSQMLVGAEHNYKLVERMPYSYIHSTKTLTLFTIKYNISGVLDQSNQSIDNKRLFFERSASQVVAPTKAIKRQALADFLAEHPLDEDLDFKNDLPDEPIFFTEKIIKHTIDLDLHWIMYFDGAA